MKIINLGQTIQILVNIGVIVGIVFLAIEQQQINKQHEMQSYQAETSPSILSNEYVDVSAIKCPSSYDDETRTFRNENYWLFQKEKNENNLSLVLRPDRDTGTWNIDIETISNKMTISPDIYEWESSNYQGNYYVLNRKDLTLERRRVENTTIRSQCVVINSEEARNEVELRYKRRLEGNKI